MQHLARGSKDAAIALAARAMLNRRLHGIGEVESLTIDTAAQSAHMQLGLVGEMEPVLVDVGRYLLHRSDGEATVTVVEATASRPWIDHSLQTFVIGRPLTIPPKVAFALKMLG